MIFLIVWFFLSTIPNLLCFLAGLGRYLMWWLTQNELSAEEFYSSSADSRDGHQCLHIHMDSICLRIVVEDLSVMITVSE